MKTKLLLIALLLALALPFSALAGSDTEPFEVALGDIRLPRSEVSTIAFKECESCEYKTKAVSPYTSYLLNNRAVSLQTFKTAVAQVVNRGETPVTILLHLDSDQVTEVSIYL